MTTEELERFIEHAFFETDISSEAFDEMMSVYNQREDGVTVDTHDLLDRFINDYSKSEETFPYTPTDESESNSHTNRHYRISTGVRRLKRLGMAAAVLVILSSVFLGSAAALNLPIWQSITQWTRETFMATTHEEPFQINEQLIPLHYALEEHDITDLVAPTWLPDGFVLEDLIVEEEAAFLIFVALFTNDEDTLFIRLKSLNDDTQSVFGRNEGVDEIYRRNNITHYIMTNNGRVSVVWASGNYEGLIFGDITRDQAKEMIDSIYDHY
jgi:hypothetical protein